MIVIIILLTIIVTGIILFSTFVIAKLIIEKIEVKNNAMEIVYTLVLWIIMFIMIFLTLKNYR